MEKVLELDQLKKILANIRKNKKIVFTNGCFDILHVGHTRYLQTAKDLADILIVAVNSDASVKKLNKGPTRPIQSEADRAEILSSLECVDFVVIFDEDTPLQTIKEIRPDILVKGGDWTQNQIVGGDFVSSYGGEVKSLPYTEGHSTTSIEKKMKD
jgi:rfaE bifunctional protein nucleotidyltransferase chain/domain